MAIIINFERNAERMVLNIPYIEKKLNQGKNV